MLGADVVMVETLRLFLGELHDRAGPFGEAIEVPTLLRVCFGSLPKGAAPAVTCQPSADRANDSLHFHLLILSVSLLLLTRRASSGSRLSSTPVPQTRSMRSSRDGSPPSSAPGCPAALSQGVQTAAGRPAAQPAPHQGIGAEGEGTRLPLPAPGGCRPKRQGERCSNEGHAV